MPGNLESSALDTEQENVSLNSDPKERLCQRMFKLPHNCMHLTSKQNDAQILKGRLQQYINQEFPMLKLDLEKSVEPEIKLPTSPGWEKKQGSSRKTSTSDLDYAKGFDCVGENKLWKVLEQMHRPDLFSCLLRNL